MRTGYGRIGSFGTALTVALLVGVTGSTSPLGAQENPYDTVVDTRMGRRLFQAECGRCHGRDGKGNDETGAPDLTTGSFKTASTDAGLFDVIRDGVPGTTMVGISWAPDHRVWQVVTYVRSLNPQAGDYDLNGDVTRGSALFREKGECATCHMVDGVGGRRGPDLTTVGNRLNPDELKVSLTDPSETVAPRWWTVKAVRADGTSVEGSRMSEDTFTVRIMDGSENLWHFTKRELRSIDRVESSPMPSAASVLNASEIDDVIAYLFSLRKES